MKKRFEGTLEVDHDRGVVYFHHKEGGCLLRIDGLESPDAEESQIDIRIRRGATPPSDILPDDLCGKVVIAEIVKGTDLEQGVAERKAALKEGRSR